MLQTVIFFVQIVWFAIQFFARIAQSLVITELGIVTVAFILMNIASSMLWLNKPLNVECVIFLRTLGSARRALQQTS